MTDIVQFIEDRLAEDEAAAKAATPGPWRRPDMTLTAGCHYWGVYADEEQEIEVAAVHVPRALKAERGGQEHADATHIARHDPARVLAEVAAKRRITELHAGKDLDYVNCDGDDRTGTICATCEPLIGDWPCDTLKALAAIWSDHPDFDRRWWLE